MSTPPLARRPRRRAAAAAPLALAAVLLAGCQGTRALMDPAVLVKTSGGFEQGVSTDYGVVFLGRTARSGDVEVMCWYGDGPNIESSVIEPLGGGLYTVETEIRLPEVVMVYRDPEAGEKVELMGRWSPDGVKKWTMSSKVARHPSVDGILLELPDDAEDVPSLLGAGVYLEGPDPREWPFLGGDFLLRDKNRGRRLLGLVSGRIRLTTDDPEGGFRVTREYLTVAGPESLWRLVTYRRRLTHKQRWVYREDIL